MSDLDDAGKPVEMARQVGALLRMLLYKRADGIQREHSLMDDMLNIVSARCSMANTLELCGKDVTANPVESAHHVMAIIHGKNLSTGIGFGYRASNAAGTLRSRLGWAEGCRVQHIFFPWATYLAQLSMYAQRDARNAMQLADKSPCHSKAAKKHK